MRLTKEEVKELLKNMYNIDMLYVGADYINKKDFDDFVDKYSNWKVGDKLKIKESCISKLSETDIFKELLRFETWTLESFIFLETIKVKGFIKDVSIDWFEKA